MKTLYFDCSMGAAGDMLTAALVNLLPNPENILSELNSLGIPGVVYTAEPSVKCGIAGTHIIVTVDEVEEECPSNDEHYHSHDEHNHSHGEHDHSHGEHDHIHSEHNYIHDEHNHIHDEHDHIHSEHNHIHDEHDHIHRSLEDIRLLVSSFDLSEKVKADIMNVYQIIAEAESKVHNTPVSDIHFHEVGTLDAIADITAVCLLIDRLSPSRIVTSPVHVGSGTVRCAHGILPVPAPATALILTDVPVYGGEIKSELCTPTGAALLKYFTTEFSNMPVMKAEKVGYGMGKKDFPIANCVRVFMGESNDSGDKIAELSFNVDDMTGEAIGFAKEQFLSNGALDVFSYSVEMKKSRPGTLITILCRPEDRRRMAELVFKHTSTIGIRESFHDRYTLTRHTEVCNTPLGNVRKKVSEGYGITRTKWEYDDLADIADELGISLSDVISKINT